MSYGSIYTCANDSAFIGRVTAASAQEGSDDPYSTANGLRYAVAAAPDVEQAYASALAAGHDNPGGADDVVTDAMILAAVQAHWPTPRGAT